MAERDQEPRDVYGLEKLETSFSREIRTPFLQPYGTE
jgi:hypothetical protein